MTDKIYNIVQFTGQNRQYYGDSVVMPEALLAEDKYVKASEMDIPLGQSRYGGPVVDLPPGDVYPDGLLFAAQLDLAVFSPHDSAGLLPKTGQLIFFADSYAETGTVRYADVPNEDLVRTVKEHESMFFAGVLIGTVFPATESLSARYRDPEFADEREYANEDGKIWDDYAEGQKSKLFGIYTNNQWDEADIREVLDSDDVVLLQVGEGEFNDEGIFSVLINRNDLQNSVFTNCRFSWAQS